VAKGSDQTKRSTSAKSPVFEHLLRIGAELDEVEIRIDRKDTER
jgi:hypothetical protein